MREILKENFSKWNWELARCSKQRVLCEERSRVMKMHYLKLGVRAIGGWGKGGIKEREYLVSLSGDYVGVCIIIVAAVIVIIHI